MTYLYWQHYSWVLKQHENNSVYEVYPVMGPSAPTFKAKAFNALNTEQNT